MLAGDVLRQVESLPFAPVTTILDGRVPLILAPHPDDESLGCGGLIAEACAQGLIPYVLVVTDGTGSHPGSSAYPASRLRALREAEAQDAVAALGLPSDRIGFLGLRDTATPRAGEAFDAAVEAVVSALHDRNCDALLGPWQHDPHGDHEATHAIAAAAASRAGMLHLAYPVWGWTLPPDTVIDGPEPAGFRLDIAQHLPAKRRAVAAHASQHGRVITDDPGGFLLPSHLLALLDRGFETFLRTSSAAGA
ncbi:MAG: PIG-L family deacetylase [Acetobacteraceae bacterium]|nr:PIG-L family deacetylase [Acetobacteraceae bacterium]